MFFRTTEQAPPAALVCLIKGVKMIFFLVCLIKDMKNKRDILFKHNLYQVELTKKCGCPKIYEDDIYK